MSSGSDKVVALRRLLDERFPAARRRESRTVPTGVPAVDRALGGGLLTGTLTEFVSATPSAGSQLSLGSVLLSTRLARQRIALVDAANAFDLETLDDDALAHVVWIRCGSLDECWRAADLAARDPNYSVVAVDVRGFPERALLRTKDSIWTRLQRAAEQAETALLIQTTTPLVPNAAHRLVFAGPMGGAAMRSGRDSLLELLSVELQRQRRQAHTG
jgi:RecA/RadA recombinase